MADNDAFVRVVLGTGAAIVLGFGGLMCLAGAGCWFGAGAFVRFGIGTDLDGYARWVEASDLVDPDRTEVLDRIEGIRQEVRIGELEVPFVVWIEIDDEIETLIWDGHVPPNELAELHDQLNRIEGYGKR